MGICRPTINRYYLLLILKMVSHQGHVVVALVCEREKLPLLGDRILATEKTSFKLADRSCMFAFFHLFSSKILGIWQNSMDSMDYEPLLMSTAADFGVMMGATAQVQQEGGGRPCPGNATEAQRPCVW